MCKNLYGIGSGLNSSCFLSAGDGDSSIEDSSVHGGSNCGNRRQMILDEETQYLLARRPDGRTDDNIYSTLRFAMTN